jgi:putative tryptophan/tyrosine transport system substrate-binding protein
MFTPDLRRIADLLIDHRLPSIGDPRAGLLLEYQPEGLRLARKAAEHVDKILPGATPLALPVEQASILDLVINLKTANALGLKIPQSLLLRANEVISVVAPGDRQGVKDESPSRPSTLGPVLVATYINGSW